MYLIGDDQAWELVDAAMKGARDDIVRAAEEYVGKGTRRDGIVLTHGHFDGVGALDELFERSDVPVGAHQRDLTHVTGIKHYVEAHPEVGTGVMALLSFAYPNADVYLRPGWVRCQTIRPYHHWRAGNGYTLLDPPMAISRYCVPATEPSFPATRL